VQGRRKPCCSAWGVGGTRRNTTRNVVKDLGENDLYYFVPLFRHFRRIDTGRGENKQRPDTQLRIRAFCPGIFAFLAVFRVVENKSPAPSHLFLLERGVYRAKMAERRNKTTYSHSPQRVNCVPRAVAPRSVLDLAGTKASPKRRKVLELELQFPLEQKSSSG